MPSRVGIVIATRDRAATLLGALARLHRLPEAPPIVVVDNGSTDGTAGRVRREYPDVVLIEAGVDRGAAARTLGVERLDTPFVAFADDDSWWAPGALPRAEQNFDAHPRLGLLCARILVGDGERLDPTCVAMARSPLPAEPDLPGPPLLGFVACGAVVRRSAYLAAGGFDAHYGVGGEESLLALDLAARGWGLAYVSDVVAHHHPFGGPRPGRSRVCLRNDMWTAWLRRPAPAAAAVTLRTLRTDTAAALPALADALRGLPWIAARRRPLPAVVARRARLLDHSS
jgi:GT2 family glycosyltransferase